MLRTPERLPDSIAAPEAPGRPKPLLLLLAAVVAVIYAPICIELFKDWVHDPNYSHGFLIAPISAFVLWQRKSEISRIRPSRSLLGLWALLFSAALYVVGTAAPEPFTQRVSLICVLASLVLFLGGPGILKKTAFPIGFLLFAVPLPYVLYYTITSPMQAMAAKFAVAGLKVAGVPAVPQGNMIHLPETSLEVAEACSGIRSLYAFLALGALLAYTMRAPVWARILVFLLTIPLSIAGNAIRVWGSGMAAYTVGPEAVEGLAHELFGLIVFAVAIGIFLLVRQGARKLWPAEK